VKSGHVQQEICTFDTLTCRFASYYEVLKVIAVVSCNALM